MSTGHRMTLVWILLLVLTFGSFVVGLEQSAGAADIAAIVIIAIAMFKVRLVGVHFMDVRVAPVALRALFEGYVLVVFVVLAVLDLAVRG